MTASRAQHLPEAVLRPVRGHHAFEACVEQLGTAIRLGVYPLGSTLPPERELALRLHVSRAIVRAAWGTPQHNPPSRFLTELPDRLVDWRRTERAVTSWRNTSATTRSNESWRGTVGYGAPKPKARVIPVLTAGDTVEIAGQVHEVQGTPTRDTDRLVWLAEARAL